MFDNTWTLYLIPLSIYFSIGVGKKTHHTLAYALIYTLFFGVVASYSNFINIIGKFYYIVDWCLVSAAFTVVLVSYCFSHIPMKRLAMLLKIAALCSLIGSTLYLIDKENISWIEHAMMNCFSVVCIPILYAVLNGYWKALIIIPIAAALKDHSASAYLLLGSLGLVTLWIKTPRLRVVWIFLAFVGVCLAIPYVMEHDVKRVFVYKQFVKWWIKEGDVLFGSGNGFFYAIGPRVFSYYHQFWHHPHSDLLRALMSLGVMGTILWIPPFFVSLRRSYENKYLFTSFCLMIIWGVTQYPLLRAWDSFLVSIIFFTAIRWRKTDVL